jgi:hypothetical protein
VKVAGNLSEKVRLFWACDVHHTNHSLPHTSSGAPSGKKEESTKTVTDWELLHLQVCHQTIREFKRIITITKDTSGSCEYRHLFLNMTLQLMEIPTETCVKLHLLQETGTCAVIHITGHLCSGRYASA